MRGIRAKTPAYRNPQAPMKSAREGNCFRLVSAGVGQGSRTITRTISPSDSLIKVSRLYLHTLVGRTSSTCQMSIFRPGLVDAQKIVSLNVDFFLAVNANQFWHGLDYAQREGPVYVRQVLQDREVLADSVVAAVAIGRSGKPRWSAQLRQSTIP